MMLLSLEVLRFYEDEHKMLESNGPETEHFLLYVDDVLVLRRPPWPAPRPLKLDSSEY